MSILSLIPLPSLAVAKGAAVAVGLAASFGAGWSVNGWRIHSVDQAAELERRTVAAQAEIENRRTESLRSTNVIEAQNAQARRIPILAADAAAARTESGRLRDALAAARSDLPSCPALAGGDDASATDQLLTAMERGIERLAQRGAGIAASADSHASDALTLQQAWPKR